MKNAGDTQTCFVIAQRGPELEQVMLELERRGVAKPVFHAVVNLDAANDYESRLS
jgi:hypothetical protein